MSTLPPLLALRSICASVCLYVHMYICIHVYNHSTHKLMERITIVWPKSVTVNSNDTNHILMTTREGDKK